MLLCGGCWLAKGVPLLPSLGACWEPRLAILSSDSCCAKSAVDTGRLPRDPDGPAAGHRLKLWRLNFMALNLLSVSNAANPTRPESLERTFGLV